MNVRAKFTVQSHKTIGDNVEIAMSAVCADEVPENQRFHKYTPSGSLSMWVTNPDVVAAMPIGTSFYVDFTPVGK